MTHPEYIYYALLVLLVLPSMLFNRMAIVVVLCWLPGQFFVCLVPELPEYWLWLYPAVDAVAASAGISAGLLLAYNTGQLLTTVFFLPLAVVHLLLSIRLLGAGEGIHPYYHWWFVFWIACIQALLVPLGNNWRPFCKWLYDKGFISDPDHDFHFFDRGAY